MSSRENTEFEDTTVEAPQPLFSLANAFRVAAVLCIVGGMYLFFQAMQFADIAGSVAYMTGLFHLGIAVIVALFLLLAEKVCRYLDA